MTPSVLHGRMQRRCTVTSTTPVALATCAIVLAALAVGADAADVTCGSGGDSAGWATAANADFDGDGVFDVAIGAPCASIAGLVRAGRVTVHSGATGRRLLVVRGSVAGEALGGAIAFVPDISGDGLADLAVGSPLAPLPNPPNPDRPAVGKVVVYSLDGDIVASANGSFGNGTFGEAVDGLADVDGDDVPDLVVGASNDRDMAGGERYGAAYLVSGRTGQVIDTSLGELRFDQWGAFVGQAGDVSGDGVPDVIVASVAADKTTASGVQNDSGLARILSGADLSQVVFEARGAKAQDKLGKSAVMVADLDSDAVVDVAVGATGVTVSNAGNAGTVTLYSTATGAKIRTLNEPKPSFNALFGSAVATIGLVDDDAVPDLAASAPGATESGTAGAGRVHVYSTVTGSVLWSAAGTIPQARFGHSLAAGDDWDGDGVADLVIGSPGDAFRGARGAGTVRLVSGVDGAELRVFGGRLGRETRLFVAGRGFDGHAYLRGVNSAGRAIGLRYQVLRGVRSDSLSVAMLDEGGAPEDLKVVVAAASGASSPSVEVLRAARGRATLSRFRAEFSAEFFGGVNVAAGDIVQAQPGEELAIVQADALDGSVELSVYRRDVDPLGRITWAQQSNFPVFTPLSRVEGTLVDADGANVAVGVLTQGSAVEEIAVGPVSGAPVVRVFRGDGSLAAEWLAYPPGLNSGTVVAVSNLDNAGASEIVTVPRSGDLRVRAFSANGSPFLNPLTNTPVDFIVNPAVTGSADSWQLSTADVDLDGRREIVIAPDGAGPTRVYAFEIDGTQVTGWKIAAPFGPFPAGAVGMAATDQFVRHR